jgi:DNA (cytosine-5)-methyltransferase 1
MLRLIREAKPQWVIAENVPGIINMGLDTVLSDLEGAGYEVEPPLIIPACAVNAQHRRNRVWIIANAAKFDSNERCQFSMFGRWQGKAEQTRLGGIDNVSNTIRPGREELQPTAFSNNERYFTGSDFERLTTTEWITEPGLCERDARIPNRVARLKALGNSVVPQIPELIGLAILNFDTDGNCQIFSDSCQNQ